MEGSRDHQVATNQNNNPMKWADVGRIDFKNQSNITNVVS